MHSVNNCLSMINNSDASEIALDKIKNILVSFEKKKRNLEKRKNKLDEYKKKADLNEDQQIAVAKYPEVMSNLELLDELTSHAVQQLKDAEKMIKKIKKQEKVDKRRCESQLMEFVLSHYSVLQRVGSTESLRRRLIGEGVTSEAEMDTLVRLFGEMHVSEKGDWRHCAEQMYGLYEAKIPRSGEDVLGSLTRVAKVEWLWLDECEEEESVPCVVQEAPQSVEVPSDVAPLDPTPNVEERLPEPRSSTADTTKMTFIFLHDSTVQDTAKMMPENGHRRISESEPRPSSQSSNHWQTMDAAPPNVEDVFSSATQSEFMHSDNNVKNAWTKGARQPLNGRFSRGRPANPMEASPIDTNYWKGGRGAFNSNPRYSRPARGRGRVRGGNGRQQHDTLTSQ